MTDAVPFTPATLGTIRRNAGRMPPAQLAAELGWSLGRLERVARENGYSLKCREPEAPALHIARPEGVARRHVDPDKRSVQVSTWVYPADRAALDAVAGALGITRSRVLTRLVEAARARHLLADLTRLPAPRAERVTDDDQPECPAP